MNEKEGEASWARALLARWQNPVYPAAQQAISKHASTDARISRAQLENARVVGQLDKKFILCFAEGAVIAVDQHAADERIRFEKFLSLFPNPEVASVRVVVELDPREMAAFERNKDEFARWGFVGRVIGGRISLEGIPEVVKDRFSDAAAVKTLLKEQLRELEHPSVRGTASIAAKTAGMPRLLKEALASRACRSSVMFGDVLAKDEMEGLVKRLAGCEVPWSCAHGRPSMAPLAQIGET